MKRAVLPSDRVLEHSTEDKVQLREKLRVDIARFQEAGGQVQNLHAPVYGLAPALPVRVSSISHSSRRGGAQ